MCEGVDDLCCCFDLAFDRRRDTAMVFERGQGRLGQSRDGVRADQLLDVAHVAIRRVFRGRRGPERTLWRCTVRAQRLPARTGEYLLEVLVGKLGAGDPKPAAQRQGTPGAVLVEQLVGGSVDSRDEEAGDRVNPRQVKPSIRGAVEPAKVGLGDGGVALEREDEGDVDAVAGGDRILDRAQSRLGGGGLDQQVREVDPALQPVALSDRRVRVPGEGRIDLPGDVAVGAAAGLPERQELHGGVADVGRGDLGEAVDGLEAETAKVPYLPVVGAAGTDRTVEDRRVGRHAGNRVASDQPLQSAGLEEIAREPVDPNGLAKPCETLKSGAVVDAPDHGIARGSIRDRTAASIAAASMPAACSSSAGVPEPGRSLTASLTTCSGRPESATASRTASASPPCGQWSSTVTSRPLVAVSESSNASRSIGLTE